MARNVRPSTQGRTKDDHMTIVLRTNLSCLDRKFFTQNLLLLQPAMEYFRFVPPTIVASLAVVSAMPAPQNPPATNSRFLPPGLFQLPQTNPNQGLQNGLAAGGLGAVGGIAATNCLFGGNCDLSFRPSIGGALDANGQFVPQVGITTQVGDGSGGIGTTFTGGVQLDGNSDSGFGGFVAGGVNDGNSDGFSPGAQTGFGFSQQNGQTQATAQLGANLQTPELAGVNFNRPGNAGGVQPTILGQAAPQLNLFNLFRPGGFG